MEMLPNQSKWNPMNTQAESDSANKEGNESRFVQVLKDGCKILCSWHLNSNHREKKAQNCFGVCVLCSVLSDSLWPHGLQPTRLLHPWDFPGKSTGVGCHCLLQYAEYIIQNAGLDDAQAGIKTAGRNSNNLRYAYDITVMAESKKELKSLLMKVKDESEKAGLRQHSKN